MRVFWQIMGNTLKTYGIYRLNFLLWRARVAINLLVVYFIWHSITAGSESVFHYSTSMIFTYILLANIVSSAVQSTQTQDVATDIRSGNLSNFLLRPFSYFSFLAARDSADKLLNILYSVVEVGLLYVLFRPPVLMQSDIVSIVSFVMAVLLAIVLYFFLNIIIGSIGFWSPEVWAPRFLVMILVQYASGWFFPLDIFPERIFNVFMATPFPYLLFFPLQLYLGTLSTMQIVSGFSIALFWIGVFWLATTYLWRRGLMTYEAYGR